MEHNDVKFINPYNFIPQAKTVKREQPQEGKLYSGFIPCSLTTKTPTIIVDKPENEEADHKVYKDTIRLGKNKDIPAIPGSELRGMIRHKYETLTNSCMSGLSEDLSFNGRYGFFMKDSGLLDLSGEQPVLYSCESFSFLKEDASYWLPTYKDGEDSPYQGYETGEKVSFYTFDSARKEQADEINEKGDHTGIVKIGEKFGKHQSVYLFDIDTMRRVECDNINQLKKDYEKLNELYKENNKTERNHPGYAKKRYTLKPVWFVKQGNTVILSLSQKGQIVFKNRLKDKMRTDEYLPCKSEPLCPACELFGTIQKNVQKVGRVRFTDALLEGDTNNIFVKKGFVLKPLSSPKYSNPIFYFDKTGRGSRIDWYKGDWNSDDADTFIRGRKEYWHYNPDLQANVERNQLNSTVDVLKTGLKYNFKVYFDEITETELIQLMYSLSLINDSDYCHKIGKGKPLGFGSVKVTIDNPVYKEIEFDEVGKTIKYELKEFHSDINENQNPENILKEVFETLDNAQLKAINHMYSFGFIKDKNRIVSYPKNQEKGDNGYEWFVSNKNGAKTDYQSALPFADQEYDSIIQRGYKGKTGFSNNKNSNRPHGKKKWKNR